MVQQQLAATQKIRMPSSCSHLTNATFPELGPCTPPPEGNLNHLLSSGRQTAKIQSVPFANHTQGQVELRESISLWYISIKLINTVLKSSFTTAPQLPALRIPQNKGPSAHCPSQEHSASPSLSFSHRPASLRDSTRLATQTTMGNGSSFQANPRSLSPRPLFSDFLVSQSRPAEAHFPSSSLFH